MKLRLRLAALAVGLATTAAIFAGAAALMAEDAGTPAGTAATRGRDGLWLGHGWVDGRKTIADAAGLARQLRGTGIRDLYVHAGPLESDGSLDAGLRPRAAPMVRALHAALPFARVLAWVGGASDGGHGLDLGREDVRGRVAAGAASVLSDGFDGVQLDLEPVRSGDASYLRLLDETRRRLGAAGGGLLSVAAFQIAPLPGPAAVSRTGFGWWWSSDFLSEVAGRVDQVALMAYDTALPIEPMYGGYVARETRLALRAVPRDVDLLIGLPAYHDDTLGHRPAETVRTAVRGVRLGLAQEPGRTNFGVAMYVDFAATDEDWREYRQGWVAVS